jgi:hypothetical protein
MNDVLIEGEPLELIQEAFRGMKAERGNDGWVSISGRLDRAPGEALIRALHRAEAHLPRRIGSTREEHRATALDEIARQYSVASHPAGNAGRRERSGAVEDGATAQFRELPPGARHLASVPSDN